MEEANKEPIFSLVMPAYNSERYVGEALEKKKPEKLKLENLKHTPSLAAAQTMPSWELLVLDDCSMSLNSSFQKYCLALIGCI